MKHDDVSKILADFAEGRLDDEQGADAEEHIAACESCHRLLDTYRMLADAAADGDGEGTEGHPTSQAVTTFALEPEALEGGERSRIEAHVRECATCADEIQSVVRIETTAGSRLDAGEPPGGRVEVPWWARVAATVALVAVGYAGWLGLYRVPTMERSTREQLEASEQQVRVLREFLAETRRRLEGVADWSGPVGLGVVSGSRPGAQRPVPVVPLAEGQPFAAISVGPVPIEDLDPATRLQCRVVGPDEEIVWSDSRSVAAHRARMGSTPFVTYLVPATAVPSGTYKLVLAQETPSGDNPLIQGPFRTLRLTP